MNYLMIENPGVADPASFTLLGASTKRGTDAIGKFGTGNKHSVTTLLRHGLSPVVFCGNLRMEFGTKPIKVSGSPFNQVVVKYGGKDSVGKNRSSTEVLSMTMEHGEEDWDNTDMALREFVSNALDEVSKLTTPTNWKEFIKIEIVNESHVRACAGTTRVFVPMTTEIFRFYENIGKWFLHFSEPELLNETILPKRGRNLSGNQNAVVYRRGVRVREFKSTDTPSLFDYNINEIKIDECRNVDDWTVKYHAAYAIAQAKKPILVRLWQSFSEENSYWEHGFDSYALSSHSHNEDSRNAWRESFELVCNKDAVVATIASANRIRSKGRNVCVVPEIYVRSAEMYGVPSSNTILNEDERSGREILEATSDARLAVNRIWKLIEDHKMTNGCKKPDVKTFIQTMESGMTVKGFYREDTVYINRNMAGDSNIYNWMDLPQDLLVTALEEVAHHVTKATDMSRDFQEYLLGITISMLKSNVSLEIVPFIVEG